MISLELNVDSEVQTIQLGRLLASVLRPGLVIALSGDLGAGKTTLVRAIVDGIGPHQHIVNSPTFVLIQEYAGTLPIVHIDAYRLVDADEFCAIGVDELMGRENVCLIEWADRVCDALPNDRLNVIISHRGPHSRRFRFDATGKESRSLLVALVDAVDASDLQRIA